MNTPEELPLAARAPLQLMAFGWRGIVRDPASLFWGFVVPIFIATLLGFAFRPDPGGTAVVAIVGNDARIEEAIGRIDGVRPQRMTAREATDALRRGLVVACIETTTPPRLSYDPTQDASRNLRSAVKLALQCEPRAAAALQETAVSEPGTRYIDFLIPGLLAFNIMSAALNGLAAELVRMRSGKLMRRLLVTPMRRSHFLIMLIGRQAAFALAQMIVLLVFARLAFHVSMEGSTIAFILYGLLGSLAFSGLGLLVASRVGSYNAVSGIITVITFPMTFLCGVFFSADRFPAAARHVFALLPLSNLVDGLRTIMLGGSMAVGPQLIGLCAWGLVSFVIALRAFRWT